MSVRCLAFFFFLMGSEIMSGQHISGFTSSKKEVLVGEPFQVEISITYPDSVKAITLNYQHALETKNELYFKDSLNFEPLADLVLLKNSPWVDFSLQHDLKLNVDQTAASRALKNTCTFAIYNPGIFKLLPPAIKGEINDSFSLYIEVVVPQMDSLSKLADQDIYPIKTIELEPAHWTDYQYWFWGIGLLLLLYYVWKKRKSKANVHEEMKEMSSGPSPADIALEKITLLRQSLVDKKLDMPIFHEKISFIIREYLENQLEIPALELASSETIQSFQIWAVRENLLLEKLKRILNYTDLVKFAKSASPEELAFILVEDAVGLVMETKRT